MQRDIWSESYSLQLEVSGDGLFFSQLDTWCRFNMQSHSCPLGQRVYFNASSRGRNFAQYPASKQQDFNKCQLTLLIWHLTEAKAPVEKILALESETWLNSGFTHFLTVWPRANCLTILSFSSSFCIMVIIPGPREYTSLKEVANLWKFYVRAYQEEMGVGKKQAEKLRFTELDGWINLIG